MSERGRSLRQVLARGAERARAGRGLAVDDAAALLREHGLTNWTGGTVLQLEAGVRPLTVEELLLLCVAYGVTPAQLAGPAGGWVELGAAARVDGGVLIDLLAGRPPKGAVDVPATRATPPPGTPAPAEALVRAAVRFGVLGEAAVGHALAAIGDAERNAARRLGVSPERLVLAAVGLWGRPLTAERDDRIEARRAATDPALHITLRGLVTRELLLELEAALAAPVPPEPQVEKAVAGP